MKIRHEQIRSFQGAGQRATLPLLYFLQALIQVFSALILPLVAFLHRRFPQAHLQYLFRKEFDFVKRLDFVVLVLRPFSVE